MDYTEDRMPGFSWAFHDTGKLRKRSNLDKNKLGGSLRVSSWPLKSVPQIQPMLAFPTVQGLCGALSEQMVKSGTCRVDPW